MNKGLITLGATAGLTAFVIFAAEPGTAPVRQITFSRDVAPIFQKSCDSCHHPGTVAPMSLMTYKDVRPWARSSASALRAAICRPGISISRSAFAPIRTIFR